MERTGKHADRGSGRRLFVKSMILTAAAVLLVLIGYFSAAFFSGGF